MKILYIGAVLDKKWPGGEPIVANNLINYLEKHGHDVTNKYYLPKFSSHKYIAGIHGIIRSYSEIEDLDKHAVKYYVKNIININPDVIIAQFDYDTSIIEAARICKKKIIVYVHIYWPICPKLSLLNLEMNVCNGFINNNCSHCILSEFKGAQKFALSLFTHDAKIKIKMNKRIIRLNYSNVTILTLNENMKRHFISNGIQKDKIVVITNGVDLQFFGYYKGLREKAICYLGSQSRNKGYEIFLKIAEKLHKDDESIKIFATGMYNTEIIKKYKYIIFTGHINRENLYKLLEKCKCLIFPSIWEEPSPAAPMEAAASGTVTIGSGIENITNIIENGVSGFIVDKYDIDEFVNKIKLVLKDEQLFQKMSVNARKQAEIYANIINTHKKILKLIEQLSDINGGEIT